MPRSLVRPHPSPKIPASARVGVPTAPTRPAPTPHATPQSDARAADMRTSIITFESRLETRFANLAADASRHARSDDESTQVDRIAQAVHAGHLTLRDAHAAVCQLRRDQRNDLRRAA